jgi:hypothetical protein
MRWLYAALPTGIPQGDAKDFLAHQTGAHKNTGWDFEHAHQPAMLSVTGSGGNLWALPEAHCSAGELWLQEVLLWVRPGSCCAMCLVVSGHLRQDAVLFKQIRTAGGVKRLVHWDEKRLANASYFASLQPGLVKC